MKAQRLILIALILGNVFLLTLTVFRPGAAEAQGVAPVLRGRGLEIVDDQGRVPVSRSSPRHLDIPRPCCFASLRRTAGPT
jgi:hypothetical protein